MKRNIFLSLGFAGLLFLWMVSGFWVQEEEARQEDSAPKTARFRVRAQDIFAEDTEEELVVSGKLEAARRVIIRSELDARVVKVGAERGSFVQEGAVLVELDPQNLPQRLSEAKALLEQKELEYEASKRLLAEKLRSEAKVAEALSAYESALAQVELITLDLANTVIRAPFSGKLQSRELELGAYVKKGDAVALIVEVDPLILVADVSEAFVNQLKLGMPVIAELNSNLRLEGAIRYIAPEADPSTRTFRIEALAENPDNIALGQTAKIIFPIDSVQAHKVSPSYLSVSDQGDLSIKLVDDENRVGVYPVSIIKSSKDAFWLKGLPEKARVITVGQGFVVAGEAVDVVLMD